MPGHAKSLKKTIYIILLQLHIMIGNPLPLQYAQTHDHPKALAASTLSPSVSLEINTLKHSFTKISSDSFTAETKRVREFLAKLSKQNIYEILDVTKDTSLQDIKSSFRKLITKWHPDKNNDLLEDDYKKIAQILLSSYDKLQSKKFTKTPEDPPFTQNYQDSQSQNKESFEFRSTTEEDLNVLWRLWFGDGKYVPPLSKILHDLESEDTMTRREAVRNLGDTYNTKIPLNMDKNSQQAIIHLEKHLSSDPASYVRTNAAIELFQLASEQRIRTAIMPLVKNIIHINPNTSYCVKGYVRGLLTESSPTVRQWTIESLKIFYSDTTDKQTQTIIRDFCNNYQVGLSENALLNPATSITNLLRNKRWHDLYSRFDKKNSAIQINNIERILYDGIMMVIGREALDLYYQNFIYLFVDTTGAIAAATNNIEETQHNNITTLKALDAYGKYIFEKDGYMVFAIGINAGDAFLNNKRPVFDLHYATPNFNIKNAPSPIKEVLSDSIDLLNLIGQEANGDGKMLNQTKKTWKKLKQEIVNSIYTRSILAPSTEIEISI
ncbi:MAG: DnaJ domain-containing protein [Candidatus Omnitrophica bacterium]|nr:DnaJ domain-containing protein [Candidatus Omnitrophota bacterium]